MALMGEYPTPEGKLLSGAIWNHMVDNFGTGKTIAEYDDPIIECVASSSNELVSSRVENYKAYIAVRDGLKDYMTQYSTIELITTGSALGTISQQRVNIIDTDDVVLSGYIGFNSDQLFNYYSMPNIFFIGGTVDQSSPTEYLKFIDRMFDIVVAWLSFPFVDINSSGMGQGIYVLGDGKIQFGQNEDIDSDDKKAEIFVEYEKKIAVVIEESQAYFAENGEPMPGIFSAYWDIIASGIVDYINTNEIVSEDAGTGVLSYNDPVTFVALTEPAVYTGMSAGVCIFGTSIVPKIALKLPPIPPVGSLSFNFNIPDIPSFPCPKVIVVDEFGMEKEINACPVIEAIIGTLTTIVGAVSDALEKAVTEVVAFVTRIMERLGYAVEYIKEVIDKLIEELTIIMAIILVGIMKGINAFLTFISEQIVIPMVKAARAIAWQALLLVPQAAIYYAVKTLTNLIQAIVDFIGKVIGQILILINKLVELIQYVVGGAIKLIVVITAWIDENIDIDIDFDDECDAFRVVLELVGNIPIPAIPALPETPETPALPVDSICVNIYYDPDVVDSTECVLCSACPDCSEPCPPTPELDDDGAEIPLVPVPSDPVDDTDPLYAVATGILETILVIG